MNLKYIFNFSFTSRHFINSLIKHQLPANSRGAVLCNFSENVQRLGGRCHAVCSSSEAPCLQCSPTDKQKPAGGNLRRGQIICGAGKWWWIFPHCGSSIREHPQTAGRRLLSFTSHTVYHSSEAQVSKVAVLPQHFQDGEMAISGNSLGC